MELRSRRPAPCHSRSAFRGGSVRSSTCLERRSALETAPRAAPYTGTLG